MQNSYSKLNNKNSYNPRSFIFLNQVITKKELEELLLWMFRNYESKNMHVSRIA